MQAPSYGLWVVEGEGDVAAPLFALVHNPPFAAAGSAHLRRLLGVEVVGGAQRAPGPPVPPGQPALAAALGLLRRTGLDIH